MVRLALAAAVALGLAGCNTSYNYFQEETAAAEKQDTTAFGAFLTMSGIIPKQREAVPLTPRAPIAIPASTELPDPNAAAAAETAVDFPVDESERERRRRAELEDLAGEYAYEQDGVMEQRNARVDPDRVQAYRREGGGLPEPNRMVTNGDRLEDFRGVGHARVSREEMRVTIRRQGGGRQILNEDGTPTERTSLAQPPQTYFTPAETAALPDPDDIENSEWIKKRVYNITDRRPPRMQQ